MEDAGVSASDLLSCCSPLIMGFTMPLSISSLPELCKHITIVNRKQKILNNNPTIWGSCTDSDRVLKFKYLDLFCIVHSSTEQVEAGSEL